MQVRNLPCCFFVGRGDWIRTSGLYVPNVALYQAEPHLEKCGPGIGAMAAEEGFEPSQTESESVVLPLHNSAIRSRKAFPPLDKRGRHFLSARVIISKYAVKCKWF